MMRSPFSKFGGYLAVLLLGGAAGIFLYSQLVGEGTQDQNQSSFVDRKHQMAAAEAAYEQEDFPEVLKLLEPMAEAGDSLAQYRLGLMNLEGMGLEINPDKGIRWLEKAASQGVVAAEKLLIEQYLDESRKSESGPDAIDWLERASALGSAEAKSVLGSRQLATARELSGDGARQAYVEAEQLLGEAAQSGDARAMSALGYMYATGSGVERSYERALEWYLKAARGGFSGAQSALAHLYELGLGTSQNLQQAGYWYVQAASAGDQNAAVRLGVLIVAGKIVPPDNATGALVVAAAAVRGEKGAMQWLEVEARNGDADAGYHLAMILLDGKSEVQNIDRAKELLLSVAQRGHEATRFFLASQYAQGDVFQQDYIQAHVWANLAAESGNADALALRENLAQLMTPDQLAQAQRLARTATQPAP